MNVQKVIFEGGVPNETSIDEILTKATASQVESFRCQQIEDPKEPALLISTSGSTGLSKMAELSHLSMRTLLHPAYMRDIRGKVCLCTSAFRWIPYFISTFRCLRARSTRILTADEKDAMYYYEIIKKYKVEKEIWRNVTEFRDARK